MRIELCNEKDCTQCFSCIEACPKKCIQKKEVDGGFYIPFIDVKNCVECGNCMKSCHIITSKKEKLKPLKVYAAWNSNDLIRKRSSSGGVFSALAEIVLKLGGIVVGAAYNESLKVKHILVSNIEELDKLRGSKYIQSQVSNVYPKVKYALEDGKYILFTGTPCQVAGLYSFLKKDYEKLYTCDLICHGVPSQKAFECYLSSIDTKIINNKEFKFRYTEGWGYQMAYNGHNIPISKSYYMKAFTKGYMFMEACYGCKYATPNRVSDITIADFWDIGKFVPFGHSTRKGISMVLVNNEKGNELFGKCVDVIYEERTLDEAILCNYNLSQPSNRPLERNTFYKDLVNMKYEELVHKYNLFPSYRDYLRPIKRILQKIFDK